MEAPAKPTGLPAICHGLCCMTAACLCTRHVETEPHPSETPTF
jgi:hypothetical protein